MKREDGGKEREYAQLRKAAIARQKTSTLFRSCGRLSHAWPQIPALPSIASRFYKCTHNNERETWARNKQLDGEEEEQKWRHRERLPQLFAVYREMLQSGIGKEQHRAKTQGES